MSHSKKEFALVVDERELATILAALRFHQDENLRCSCGIADQEIKDIASSCGSLKPLNFDDVSRLCERMNLGDDRCNWCGKEITGEAIKWRGVCFCSDGCLDECRAIQ
jgi:hypothetical protein